MTTSLRRPNSRRCSPGEDSPADGSCQRVSASSTVWAPAMRNPVNNHCSKVCCVTAVKQAIEVRKMLPACEVFCFYMDMRMYGPYYEELYRESQEVHNVNYIRGKVSGLGPYQQPSGNQGRGTHSPQAPEDGA